MQHIDDVIIIGGGIIGINIAYHLEKNGLKVRIIEKNKIGLGASEKNASLLAANHIVPYAAPGMFKKALKWMLRSDSPFYIKPSLNKDLLYWLWLLKRYSNEQHVQDAAPVLADLLLQNLELIKKIKQEEELNFSFWNKGIAYLFSDKNNFLSEIRVSEQANRLNLPAVIYEQGKLHELDPSLENAQAIGAIHYLKDAHTEPFEQLQALAGLLKSKNVVIEEDCEVINFEKHHNHIKLICNNNKEFQARNLVIANGGWAGLTCKKLNINLPLQPAKGYSLTYQKDTQKHPQIPFLLAESKVAITPFEKTIRLAGTLELSGFDKTLKTNRLKAILQSPGRYFNDFPVETDLTHAWYGYRSCTPDGMPIIGPSSKMKNVFFAVGHNIIGVSLAQISGKLISEHILEKTPSVKSTMILPKRFEK